MSWLSKIFEERDAEPVKPQIDERPGGYYIISGTTKAGKPITIETSQSVATAYRAANIISDDIAKMPLQMFERRGDQINRISPDHQFRNRPYLVEICPNNFGWTPFIFKKSMVKWLLFYGNTYVWSPPVSPSQMFILPADRTIPVLDKKGHLWYEVLFEDGYTRYLPAVEVLHVMINPDRTGFKGRGVITFARENLARQIAAYDVESGMLAKGMNPSMILKMSGNLDKSGRNTVREAYQEAISGSDNAGGVAVFDNKVLEWHQIEMKLVDMQFLEAINATDRDIANFFGMPLHMLNMGKEAYNSNEQKFIEYLSGTLDAYLVQIEQGARIRWLPINKQDFQYFKFNRNALLRMDAKTRAEYYEIRTRGGNMMPNEARALEDENPYSGGDKFWMTKNYAPVDNFLEGEHV